MLPDECRSVLSDPVLLPLCLGVGLLPLGPLALLFADDLFGVLFLFQILHGAPALRSGLFEPRRARLVGIALQHVQRVDRPAAVRIAQPELGKRALVALLCSAESGGFSRLARRLVSGVLFPALSGRFGGLLLLFACGFLRFSAGLCGHDSALRALLRSYDFHVLIHVGPFCDCAAVAAMYFSC